MSNLQRKGHFLGAKLRSIRKRNGLTLEELSARCIQLDATAGAVGVVPEHDRERQAHAVRGAGAAGQRVPARGGLVPGRTGGHRRCRWRAQGRRGDPGAAGTCVLFSKELLQSAIPELLAQTGTSGRQFAHLLIRSHQEMSRNDFPDLERTAESIGERRLPLTVEDLIAPRPPPRARPALVRTPPVLVRDNNRRYAARCARSSSRRIPCT